MEEKCVPPGIFFFGVLFWMKRGGKEIFARRRVIYSAKEFEIVVFHSLEGFICALAE